MTRTIRLCMLGFGNVGQALARLVQRKRGLLAQHHGVEFVITGIRTGRHGSAIDPQGIDFDAALDCMAQHSPLERLSRLPAPADALDFIRACPADVLVEVSPVNHHTGQPAVDHLKTGLECGMHAVTANKGPVVHGYRLLSDLARQKGRSFFFESAVMDGAPIFSLFRYSLPAVDVHGFFGILNSCTNLLLERMEGGETFEQAVDYARSIGITETDPAADVDGWDAAIKVAALATVVMGEALTAEQVQRQGIRGVTPAMLQEALDAGERWKLVCRAWRQDGRLLTSVAPERVKPISPLYSIGGTSSYVQFELDTLPGLGIVESNPSPDTTAYGLLADILNALRE